MSGKLSDEHLDSLEYAHGMTESAYTPTCRSANYGSGCPGATDDTQAFWRLAMDAMPALLAEVRHLRALLATPFDCGWPEPRVDRGVVPPLVLWNPFSGDDSNAMTFEPDEAKAIGAAFMRAGLAALDQKGDIK